MSQPLNENLFHLSMDRYKELETLPIGLITSPIFGSRRQGALLCPGWSGRFAWQLFYPNMVWISYPVGDWLLNASMPPPGATIDSKVEDSGKAMTSHEHLPLSPELVD